MPIMSGRGGTAGNLCHQWVAELLRSVRGMLELLMILSFQTDCGRNFVTTLLLPMIQSKVISSVDHISNFAAISNTIQGICMCDPRHSLTEAWPETVSKRKHVHVAEHTTSSARHCIHSLSSLLYTLGFLIASSIHAACE
jgi:hypothetical protein